jgi:hypothetical protein
LAAGAGRKPEIFRELKHGHPSYPLFLPAGLAGQFALAGADDILTPAIQALVFTAATAVAIGAGVHLLGGARLAPLAAALFLATPSAQLWGFSQCADVPLAYLFTAAGTGLAAQLTAATRRAFPPWVAGLTLGLLPWTKNEGAILAVILLAVWLASRRALPAADRPPIVPVLAGLLPGVLALAAFKLMWLPQDEISMFAGGALTRALDPERWRIVPLAFWRELDPRTGIGAWGLVWPLLLVLAILGRRALVRRPEVRFLGLSVALTYGAWFGVYLGTVHDPTWHLETSLVRLLLQPLPLALVAAFAAVAGSRGKMEHA